MPPFHSVGAHSSMSAVEGVTWRHLLNEFVIYLAGCKVLRTQIDCVQCVRLIALK